MKTLLIIVFASLVVELHGLRCEKNVLIGKKEIGDDRETLKAVYDFLDEYARRFVRSNEMISRERMLEDMKYMKLDNLKAERMLCQMLNPNTYGWWACHACKIVMWGFGVLCGWNGEKVIADIKWFIDETCANAAWFPGINNLCRDNQLKADWALYTITNVIKRDGGKIYPAHICVGIKMC